MILPILINHFRSRPKMKKLILLLVFIPSIANAKYFEDFSTQDWVLQGVFTGVVYIDWRQTRDFIKKEEVSVSYEGNYKVTRKKTYFEINPLLGKNPSKQKIDNMIALGVLSHWFISWMLPQELWRTNWQYGTLSFEVIAINRNHENGFKVQYYLGW